MMRHYSLRYLLFLYASDTLVVIGALLLSSALRINIPFGIPGVPEAFIPPTLLYPVAVAIWLFTYSRAGVYGPRRSPDLLHELRNLLVGHGMAALIFFGWLYVGYRDFSRVQALYFIGISLAAMAAYRMVARLFVHRFGRLISDARRVLVVGTDANGLHLGQTVARYDWAGLHLVGYAEVDPLMTDEAALDPAMVLGTLEDLPRLVETHQVNEVLIPLKWFDDATSSRITQIMRQLESQAVNIRLAPDYSDLAYFQTSAEDFNGIPLIGIRERVFSPGQRLVKRTFDVVFSALMLVLTSPIMLVIALAIKLDSPGPVFYRQKRVGEYGPLFEMIKFSPMYVDAPEPGVEYAKSRHDPRVTRVGRILRRFSLDELPQFLNVLRGDMSVVGPRPEVPGLVSRYEWWQRKRFEVPQGMTGWWQVNGRSDKPMHLHTEDDLFYIRNYSLWLDVQIVLRTPFALLSGKGAF